MNKVLHDRHDATDRDDLHTEEHTERDCLHTEEPHTERECEHVRFEEDEREETASDTEPDSGNGSDPVHEYFTYDAPDGGYGWVVCACAFLHQLIADGLLFSFGVIYLSLLEHFNRGKSETSWVGAVLMGTSMITGPAAGAVASRFSMRTAGIAGSLIAAIGLLASYFAPSILILTFTYGMVTGTGVGFMFLTSILACSVYFKKRRALANGIAMCGSGVGVFILSPLLVRLIDLYGWEGSMLFLSGIALNGCVVSMFYRPLPATRHTDTFIIPDCNSDSGFDPAHDEDDDMPESIVNKNLRLSVRMEFPGGSISGLSGNADTLTPHMRSMSKLAMSSHSLARSNYWENVQTDQLSHLDLCQIGSMLTIPTMHSMKEHGLTHSRSAMTLEEKDSYMFWRYNNYECSALVTALGRTLSCHLLKNSTMLLLILAGIFWTGQSTTYIFIVDYASSIGVSDADGCLLLSAIGITNCVGRIVVGFLTDSPRVNSTLVYMVSIAVAGVVNIILPFVDSYAALVCLAVVFGLSMASYVSIRSIVMVDTMGIENLAGTLGLVIMFQGFAFTIVPPIAGAILETTLTFKGPFIASGICYLISALILVPIFVRYYRCTDDEHCV